MFLRVLFACCDREGVSLNVTNNTPPHLKVIAQGHHTETLILLVIFHSDNNFNIKIKYLYNVALGYTVMHEPEVT